MISLTHLNKSIIFIIFIIILTSKPSISEDEPADIWDNQNTNNEESSETQNKKNINLFKFDKLIIADFLLDKFCWLWKIYFIKQKYS